MTTLVRGMQIPDAQMPRGSVFDFGSADAETVAAIDLSGSRRGQLGERLDLDALDPTRTLCEVDLDDGTTLWLRPGELRDSPYFDIAYQRDGEVELVPVRRASRGAGQTLARLLKVFRVDPVKLGADLARDRLVAHLERDVREGLFQVGAHPADLQPVEAARFKNGSPCLLLLHGTFSSTVGSFGALHTANGGQPWQKLSTAFDRRILALDHRSLSVSPLRNALDAAHALPGGLRLHLLSHSRGGLIGELLTRHDGRQSGFTPQELELLDAFDAELAADARELDRLLRDKAFRVERFVRVACPARGTSLASDRARKWLTIVVNMLARLLKLGADAVLNAAGGQALIPVARRAVDLLQVLSLELIRIDEIPGLSAMDPGGTFIRGLINNESARSVDQLAVVAGDAEGDGVFGRIKMFAVDQFFERDNDLVVDTPSMTGGARREHAYRFLTRGSDVSHTTYFGHPRTSELIVDALTATDPATIPEFVRIDIDRRPLRSPLRTPVPRSHRADLPIVFLLPGIMGTHLRVDDEIVWVDKWELIRGGFGRLRIEPPGTGRPEVVPAHLDGDTYQSLADALALDHEVVPFPYDWRLAIDDSARRLNALVRERLGQASAAGRPIRFVAHSMGGLVVRAMMALQDSVWPEVANRPGSRFVMLGTPNAGSHAISLLLTGNDKLVKLLALADLKNSLAEIVGFATGFPGALDMAPVTGERDYFSQAAWAELASAKSRPSKWPLPTQDALDASRRFREALARQNLGDGRTYYIAGQAQETPVEVRLDRTGERTRLKFLATRQGDGRVPWQTGIPAGVKAWYVPAKHGDIPAYTQLYPGLRDILDSGSTEQLADSPPVTRDLPGEYQEYLPEEANYLPDADELMDAAMCSDRAMEVSPPETLPPVDVQVSWSNLRYANDPVVVGHYIGDQIASAEGVLDRFLEGALSRRLALGRYPGEIGTTLVIPHASGDLPGAVVLGLGQVSTRLTRSNLSLAVQCGVCEWAARVLEAPPYPRDGGDAAAADPQRGLAFVAVGSGSGGMSIGDAGMAILEGVERALNLLLQQRGMPEVRRLNLSRVHFLELYEDRAHTLWHGLSHAMARRAESGSEPSCLRFPTHSDQVLVGKGGRRRLVMDDIDGWWTPLKITQAGSRLKFENIGDRARAELYDVATHAAQIDMLMRRATSSSQPTGELSRALFEMLLPNDLKDTLPSGDRLRLIVDKHSARYPWELILAGHQRADEDEGRGAEPAFGSTLGIIRQFASDDFRPLPRMATGKAALVVGDPICADESFPPLPRALAEAQAVHSRLGQLGHKLPETVLRRADQILVHLYQEPYQILHFAGHGVQNLREWLGLRLKDARRRLRDDGRDPDDTEATDLKASVARWQSMLDEIEEQSASAMVIGADHYLTYRNIKQMRQVPELVFINCCHLGAIPPPDDPRSQGTSGLAAGFARAFIGIGVRAVIAAGWPVDDDAAQTFAEVFYVEFCAGVPFGDAVREARLQTRERHPSSNSWAAYQCYGDPSYRYSAHARHPERDGSLAMPRRYGSPRQLAWEAVSNVADVERLNALCATAQERNFVRDGELCAAIAEAYRGFKDFKQATTWYRRAIAAENGSMELHGIEQLVNLIARSRPADGDAESAKRWSDQLDEALDLLERLNKQSPSQERLNLIGSAHKRRAMALTGKPRTAALSASAKAYREAADIANLSDPSGNPYAFVNAAVMLAAAAWSSGGALPTPDIKALALEAERRAQAIDPSDFWGFIVDADVQTMKLFAGLLKSTSKLVDRIVEIYLTAYQRDRNPGNLASVVDQLRFMESSLGQVASNTANPGGTGLRKAIKTVAAKLSDVIDR